MSGVRCLAALLFVFIPFAMASSKPNYFVVAPNIFHCNTKETVSVSVTGVRSAVSMTLTLQNVDGETFSKRVVSISEGSPKLVEMMVRSENLPKGKQNKYVKLAVQSGNFVKSQQILVDMRSGYLFIQTDKPIYSPREEVKIRIFPLNEYLLPSYLPFWLDIKDPKGIIVFRKEYEDYSTLFIKKTYRFVSDAQVGKWKISTKYKDELTTNTSVEIEVRKYVLPKFDITIRVAEKCILPSMQTLSFEVVAKYVYGKPVNGKVKVHLSIFHGFSEIMYLATLTKDSYTSGPSGFVVRKEILSKIPRKGFTKKFHLRLTVEVTEKETLLTERAVDSSVLLSEQPYKLDIGNSLRFFKPGLYYYFKLNILHANNDEAPEVSYILKVYGQQKGKTESLYELENKSNSVGYSKVPIATERNFKELLINVSTSDPKYKEKEQAHVQMIVKAYQSDSSSYVVVSLTGDKKNYLLNEALDFKIITSRSGLLTMNYLITGGGKIVQHKSFKMNKFWQVSELVKSSMLPTGGILVYYFHNGEVVADSVTFELSSICADELEITLSQDQPNYHPGENVTLKVTGKQGTHVGLLAVDKAVYLLNNRQQMTRKQLQERRKSHDIRCSPGGGADSAQVFYDAGLTVITNMDMAVMRRTQFQCYQTRVERSSNRCCMAGMQLKLKNRTKCLQEWLKNVNFQKDELCREKFISCCITGIQGKSVFIDETDEKLNQAPIYKYFPESWLFEETHLDFAGRKQIEVTLPDSITTWTIQAVGVSDRSRFCIAKPANIRVFKNLLVHFIVPYSLVRLEQLEVRAVIYNYNLKPVKVQLHHTGVKGICSAAQPGQRILKKILTVPPNDVQSFHFPIVPLEQGKFKLILNVLSGAAIFTVEKTLHVEAEGVTERSHLSLLLDPSGIRQTFREWRSRRAASDVTIRKNEINVQHHNQTIILDLTAPSKAIPGTAGGKFVFTGSVLGPTVEPIIQVVEEDLKEPFGCGEQTMIFMAPAVYTMKYLKSRQLNTPKIEDITTNYMQQGVSREQEFRKEDGSYSAFLDRPSSTWLTAFVMKVFCQADKFIHIDGELIHSGMMWLFTQQDSDGSFVENNPVLHKEMLGGVNNRNSMTAFAVISLLECSHTHLEAHHHLKAAVQYLEQQLDRSDNCLSTAMTAYALALANSKEKIRANKKLKSMAIEDEDKDIRYWLAEEDSVKTDFSIPAWFRAQAIPLSVEITAYALLTQLVYRNIAYSNPIVKWLIEQRELSGKFKSTQDTILALQALAEYGIKSNIPDTNMHSTLSSEDGMFNKHIHINSFNSLLRNVVDKVPVLDQLLIETSGVGLSQLQFEMKYNRPAEEEEICQFDLTIKTYKVNNYQDLRNRSLVCQSCGEDCTPADQHDQIALDSNSVRHRGAEDTGMAILDIGMLTGYEVPTHNLEQLRSKTVISNFEASSRSVVLYLDKVPSSKDLCIKLHVVEKNRVNNQESASVLLYDYYNKDRKCQKFYKFEPHSANIDLFCGRFNEKCHCAVGACPSINNRYEVRELGYKFLINKACIDNNFVFLVNIKDYIAKRTGNSTKGKIIEVLKEMPMKSLETRNTECILSWKPQCYLQLEVGHTYMVMVNKMLEEFKGNKKWYHFLLENGTFIANYDHLKVNKAAVKLIERLNGPRCPNKG